MRAKYLWNGLDKFQAEICLLIEYNYAFYRSCNSAVNMFISKLLLLLLLLLLLNKNWNIQFVTKRKSNFASFDI
jgi:hypothetical protein